MNNNLTDWRNIISKFTIRRAFNGYKLVLSFYLSKWTKKTFLWGNPASISIEPTTSCNLRCPECPSGLRSFTRPIGMLEESLFKKTIDELHNNLLYLIFYFQGEPYLNPHFLDLVKYASSKNIYTATSTNAHYLTDENARKTVESGLDRLIISIDGTSQETYQSYRIGGKLDKVIEGTKNIIRWKKELNSKTPHVIFQFLVVKANEHQIPELKALAKELGVNEVGLKTAQIYDYENGSELIPENTKYSRYRKTASGKYEIKNHYLNHCWKLWHSCVITWDGIVVPCCFDKDAEYRMGSLKADSMKKVWNGKEYKIFRASVLKARSEIEMCKNCSEGTQVWS